ncbi:thioredoxin domain-containing protein [Aerococcaceae bacterium 50-4]
MTFQIDKITYQDAIKLGEDTAKVKVVEYYNLACPDALDYQEHFAFFLDPLVKTGQVQRILKHYNKTSPRLQKGNLVHDYIDYSNQKAAYALVDQYMRLQNDWAQFNSDELAAYLTNQGLIQEDNSELAAQVFEEAQAVGVGAVPTIFIEGQAFVETVDPEAFKQAIMERI